MPLFLFAVTLITGGAILHSGGEQAIKDKGFKEATKTMIEEGVNPDERGYNQ